MLDLVETKNLKKIHDFYIKLLLKPQKEGKLINSVMPKPDDEREENNKAIAIIEEIDLSLTLLLGLLSTT